MSFKIIGAIKICFIENKFQIIILKASILGSFWLRVRVRVRVRVILRLAVYRLSVCLGEKPLETHDQNLYFPTEHLRL
jgi:hypothetical protein